MYEEDVGRQYFHTLVLGGAGVRSRLQQPTDLAGLIHLLQRLHILVFAGVIGAYLVECFISMV